MSALERAFNNRVVNPVMLALITHGLGPPTYAVVENTGRKTARKRLVPVGEKASYVHTSAPTPGSGSSRARPGCATGSAPGRGPAPLTCCPATTRMPATACSAGVARSTAWTASSCAGSPTAATCSPSAST